MSSTKFARILPMILALVSAAFGTAPGWVDQGAVIEYSADGTAVTFSVLERTSTDIEVRIMSTYQNTAHENVSALYGQFWFDDSKLAGASRYHRIEEFEVTEVGSRDFAGETWNTVTLVGMISGAQTTRIYDKETGLMLKQMVQATGAPVVEIEAYSIQGIGESATPPFRPDQKPLSPDDLMMDDTPPPTQPADDTPPPPDDTAQTSNQTAQPANDTAAQSNDTAPPEPDAIEPEDDTTEPTVTTTQTAVDEEEGPPKKKKLPCLPGAILLLLAGLVFFRSQ